MKFKIFTILFCIVCLTRYSFSLSDEDRDKYIGISRTIERKIEKNENDIDTSSLPTTTNDIELRGLLEDIFSDLSSYYSYRFYDLNDKEAWDKMMHYAELKKRNES